MNFIKKHRYFIMVIVVIITISEVVTRFPDLIFTFSNSFNVRNTKELVGSSKFFPRNFENLYLGQSYFRVKELYPNSNFIPYSGTVITSDKDLAKDSLFHITLNFNTDELDQDGESPPISTAKLTKFSIQSYLIDLDIDFPNGFEFYYDSLNFNKTPYHGLAILKTKNAICILRPLGNRPVRHIYNINTMSPIFDQNQNLETSCH